MPKVKIAMIGAGSAVFTSRLVADILQTNKFDGSTVYLMDIEPSVLPTVCALSRRMVDYSGRDIKIEAGARRKEALDGADFVMTTIAVGGLNAWAIDATLPERYGVYQPVGDSVGPGGISRALRQVPAMLDIARDMEKYCPNAWLINYSNPMSANCLAVQKYTSIKTIGLCHGTPGVAAQIANWFDADISDVQYRAAGVNHLTWFLEFKIKGKDVAQKLDSTFETRGIRRDWPICCSLYDRFGRFPAPWDAHVAEFFTDYLSQYADHGGKYGLGFRNFPEMRKARRRESARVKKIIEGKIDPGDLMRGSGETAIGIMLSLLEGHNQQFMANVLNNGIVDNLPQNLLVEVPTIFGKFGMVPIRIGKMPDAIAAITTLHMQVCNLVVEAAIHGCRKTALQAILLDPLSKNSTDPEGMLDALLHAQKKHLPQFKITRGSKGHADGASRTAVV